VAKKCGHAYGTITCQWNGMTGEWNGMTGENSNYGLYQEW
jgi:hypothetical protein